MLLLDNDDVEALLTLDDCMGAIAAAYREVDDGQAAHGPRETFHVSMGAETRYSLASMDGVSRGAGYAAVRIRSDFVTRDTARGVERKYAGQPGSFCGLVLLFDIADGRPAAILNDGRLQQLRVGATAALAADRMARADARVLGIIGSGNQARAHARAYAAIRPLEEIRVYSPSADRRDALVAELGGLPGVRVRAVGVARDAVEGADIVAACTNATSPVLEASWLSPGTHVSSVRHRHEVGSDVLERAHRVFLHVEPDAASYALGERMEGGSATPTPSGLPTLVDLLVGREPGRISDHEVTYFLNNMGTGLQFAACASVVYRRALERGRGRELPEAWFLQDISD